MHGGGTFTEWFKTTFKPRVFWYFYCPYVLRFGYYQRIGILCTFILKLQRKRCVNKNNHHQRIYHQIQFRYNLKQDTNITIVYTKLICFIFYVPHLPTGSKIERLTVTVNVRLCRHVPTTTPLSTRFCVCAYTSLVLYVSCKLLLFNLLFFL